MKKKHSGISKSLAKITAIPLLLFGIVTTMFSSYWVSLSMEDEVQTELSNLCSVAGEMFSQLYPGDYAMYTSKDEILVTKGDTILNGNYNVIDSLKEKTNVDYSLFYGDMRILTTIHDHDGERIIGSKANSQIISDVIHQENSTFYSNVEIFDSYYYAYYTPLYNSNDECVGMLAALMPVDGVRSLILHSTLPILILAFIAIVFVLFWTHHYAKELTGVIQKLTTTCEKVSHGTLSNTVPPELLARKDELGTMAHSLVDMQSSLRTFIEQDVLTGLYNRRFGQQKIEQMVKQTAGTNTHFSLALGDIDHFKKFNDTYGHDCGDLVLQEIAHFLQHYVRDYGYCIRWGGEEFMIVFANGSYEQHEELCRNLIKEIEKKELYYNKELLSITMTFGLIDTSGYHTPDEMVKEVDNLLYYGKTNGRNCLITK